MGRRRGDRSDARPSRPTNRGGSRSRRAQTTCSGMPGSGATIAPVRVATGEHIQNRVIFKQLFQAEAIDFCQLDACRVGGVNEAIAILLLAAKFGVPVCPHAGGVGLCEYVQHLAFFDYVAVSGSTENRVVEWVDHLHEHFRDPADRSRRPLYRAGCTRLQHRDTSRVTRRVRVPARARLVGCRGRRGRRMMAAVSESRRHSGGVRRPGPLRAPPGRALVASRRSRADPGPPDRDRRADDTRLPHDAEPRQRLLPDVGHRGARPRAAARNRDAGIDLSVGATIALSGVVGAIVYEDTGSSVLVIAAILGTGLAVGAVNGLVFVYGRVPHPFIVTLATLSIVRGIALWGSDGTLISGMPPIVQTIGGGSINWIPYSIFVVIGLACRVLRADDPDGLGPLAVRGRRERGRGSTCEHPDPARAHHRLCAEWTRRRLRRADHCWPDRRGLTHGGRSRRARLDRGGDHRGRRLRGWPGSVANALVGASRSA